MYQRHVYKEARENFNVDSLLPVCFYSICCLLATNSLAGTSTPRAQAQMSSPVPGLALHPHETSIHTCKACHLPVSQLCDGEARRARPLHTKKAPAVLFSALFLFCRPEIKCLRRPSPTVKFFSGAAAQHAHSESASRPRFTASPIVAAGCCCGGGADYLAVARKRSPYLRSRNDLPACGSGRGRATY